jgi:Nucleotidyltransferase domain
MSAVPAMVDAVWLFGSFARQSRKAYSDLDLLVLTADGDSAPDGSVLKSALDLPQVPDISHYTRSGILRIIDPPSLFAWHLRLEGTPLFQRTDWLQERLCSLQPYNSYVQDLATLQHLHEESRLSLQYDRMSLCFDAGVLGIITRNAALLLTHFDGCPDFSPDAPLSIVDHPTVRLPITRSEYLLLHQSRLAMERGEFAPTLSYEGLQRTALSLGCWLESLRKHFSRRQ